MPRDVRHSVVYDDGLFAGQSYPSDVSGKHTDPSGNDDAVGCCVRCKQDLLGLRRLAARICEIRMA